MLITGRLVIGFGIGVLTMVVRVYQAEIGPPHERAFLMSIESIMTALGYVIANWIGYGASFSTTTFQWRFPLAVQILFALLVLFAAPFLPESPRWLIEKDNDELAFALLKKLHFTGDNTDFINKQFQEMRDQIRVEKEQTVRSYKGILMRPAWRRRVFLACGVWIGVSLTGITGFLKDLVAIFTVIFSNKGANNPEPSDKSSSSTLKQSDSSRGDLPESKKCRNEIKKFRSRCFSS